MTDPSPASPELELLGSAQLRERTVVRVLSGLIRLRGAFLPVLLGFDLWIALTDQALWRRLVMFGIAAVLATLIVHDLITILRQRRERLASVASLTPTLFVVALMQHLLVFVTGGMASPVVPVVLLPLVVTGLLMRPRFAWAVALAVHLPALWVSAGVQLSGLVELTPTVLAAPGPAGGSGQPALVTVVVAGVMSLATIMTTLFSTLTAAGLYRMVDEALRARDSALVARSQQARELTTLSGEIAHELKNPLASVKGLAQLVGRELERAGPSKSAERVQVLRREVDRMQAILDEFLNFSRPLIPLNLRAVELRELVTHVVDLHEGVAGERRVALRVHGQAALRCDPRKVEQILINVVQNALEVAPPGSELVLEIGTVERDAVLEVRDRGPGLAAGVRERVFEPGVTGKPEGSGLGLTIARALARQHGGELELADRGELDGGPGCVATLTLPQAGPAPEPEQRQT